MLKGWIVHQRVRKVLALLLPNDTCSTFGLCFVTLSAVLALRPWRDSSMPPTLILRRRQFLQPFLDFL